MDDPIWISRDLAVAVHERQLAEHGGADGVRDTNLLDAALNRPRNLFAYGDPTPDLVALAASYAYGIARNHAFIDGNKRTAYVVCRVFLLLNGLDMTAAQEQRYEALLALAAGELAEDAFADWLRADTRR